MIRAGRCFDFSSSEVEEVESRRDVEQGISKSDFLQDSRVFCDERRRSWLDYLDKLHRDPLRDLETEECKTSSEKRSVGKVRHSKKSVRRSSALVKSRGTSEENCDFCSDSVHPEPACCHSRMNVLQDYGGSILRGKTRATETQTSRSRSRNSFLVFPRTKGSRNRRTENKRKFPPVRNISNGFRDPAGDKCCCFSNAELKKDPENHRRARFHSKDSAPRSKDCVITTASTSEEETIDYQVPIGSSSSSRRLYDTESGSKTLVPTSSHVTIRICSQNSNSSIHRDEFYDEKYDRGHFSGSENSANHFEERVRRSMKAMCGRDRRGDDCLEEELEKNEPSFESRCSPSTECQVSSNNFTPRSRRNTCCCKCSKKFQPMIDFEETSDQGSFQRFKDVLTETRRRRGARRTSRVQSGPEKKISKPERTMCEPMRPRRVVRKTLTSPGMNVHKKMATNGGCLQVRDPLFDPLITLSAQRYREFCDRCERIRKSIGKMMREEIDSKEMPVWKGDSLNLRDFTPDLPPLDHWSQYEDGMRKVAAEYRTLKSCVNLVEGEKEKKEKSVTRTYPSGTEFTFGVKRVSEKKACKTFSEADRESSLLRGSKKSSSTQRNEKFCGKDRSVCFDKNQKEEESCVCDCPEEVKPRNNISQINGLENIEDMKTREADLVKTLETFCEKMKTMKTEFDKSSSPGFSKGSDCCRSCGRGRGKTSDKMKAKKLLIFPPQGENGPPLTLYKNSSSVNCRVKGDSETGFRYNVVYIQRFVSSTWNPDKETCKCCVDSG